jgi:hypothetical protein
MNLSTFKQHLNTVSELHFVLPDGSEVPAHFHITEVGQVNKKFIDCGGTMRSEQAVCFQLWEANDYDHKLKPTKLQNIISLSEEKLGLEDGEIEVEYQANTIGKYGLDFNGKTFLLTNKFTACLASDQCGIPSEKIKLNLTDLTAQSQQNSCTPGGKCC